MKPNMHQQMCCITIGFERLLVPATAGTKLMALLTQAVPCQLDFRDRHNVYEVQANGLRVSMELVQPDQIRMPDNAEITPPIRRPARLLASKG